MADKPQLLRETDEEARRLARTLVRGARHMALAVIDPQTGYPSASRVLTGTDWDAVPVILVSALSGHTRALLADPRCSLLAGEPGKGDPLAHPRITLQCEAQSVARDSQTHGRIRTRFLARHPKAELYVDFPDFAFFRLRPVAASMNGGFGRAYALEGRDLVIGEAFASAEWFDLQNDLKSMTNEANDFADKIGARHGTHWRFSGVDRAGLDLIAGDVLVRHEFEQVVSEAKDVLAYISEFTKSR